MFLQALDLTTALRPELWPDETLLFVQDAVGLYEGKYKIQQYQNGHVYLTSHRICYVDNDEARKNSRAIELANIEKYDYFAGFLKSSPKITLFPNTSRVLASSRSIYGTQSRGISTSPLPGSTHVGTSQRAQVVTWVCSICSFSNELPTNFNPAAAQERNAIPPCLSCGIKPTLAELVKAAIANAAHGSSPSPSSAQSPYQPPQPQPMETHRQYHGEPADAYQNTNAGLAPSLGPLPFVCPRCTFENHPSLLSCELCGASLVTSRDTATSSRPASPGPSLEVTQPQLEGSSECIKLSFRAGGDKVFHERLKGAMVQRKWLLLNAPPVPMPQASHSAAGTPNTTSGTSTPHKAIGIAGLERLGLDLRKTNETIIGSAFADLEALMASAKDIIALAESFAAASPDVSTSASSLLSASAAAASDMAPTKDMLDASSPAAGADALYLSELARTLAEHLTDDTRGLLRRAGGVISLVDLWAAFNRARNGVELVRPADFAKAARLWDPLGLPVHLREFRNGLLVVQRADWTDDKTIAQLLAWIREPRATAATATTTTATTAASAPNVADLRISARFGRGVTALEAAGRFGWSVGVATEELSMAEERGALCREEGIEGLRFWENWIVGEDEAGDADGLAA